MYENVCADEGNDSFRHFFYFFVFDVGLVRARKFPGDIFEVKWFKRFPCKMCWPVVFDMSEHCTAEE